MMAKRAAKQASGGPELSMAPYLWYCPTCAGILENREAPTVPAFQVRLVCQPCQTAYQVTLPKVPAVVLGD